MSTSAPLYRHAPSWTALDGALLVQCMPAHAESAAQLSNGGLVVCGPRSMETAQQLRQQGFLRPILCDAQKYTGAKRKFARESFDRRWLSWQLERGEPTLTDSGYVAKYDITGLRTILRRTMRLGSHAIAVLPLHADWLKVQQDREILLAEVSFAEVPVAIAIEHAADPLSVREVVRGLLALIGTGVPIVLLRSDVSALGALCHGALAAAVGTTTALRHIHPLPKPNSGGFRRTASTAVLVPHLLSYVSADKLAAAVQLTPDQHLWVCECTTCNGRTMDYIATLGDTREVFAFRHSLEHLYLVHGELMASRLSSDDRKIAWREHCNAAAAHHVDIRTELPDWRTPSFISAWRGVT